MIKRTCRHHRDYRLGTLIDMIDPAAGYRPPHEGIHKAQHALGGLAVAAWSANFALDNVCFQRFCMRPSTPRPLQHRAGKFNFVNNKSFLVPSIPVGVIVQCRAIRCDTVPGRPLELPKQPDPFIMMAWFADFGRVDLAAGRGLRSDIRKASLDRIGRNGSRKPQRFWRREQDIEHFEWPEKVR